jgi:hypothetical protein
MEDTMPPTLTANQLRALAEKADGYRNEQLSVVLRQNGSGTTVEVVKGSEKLATDKELFGLGTNDNSLLAPAGTSIIVKTPNGFQKECVGIGDALFWSRAAVEKFVLPYYAGFKTPEELQAMMDAISAPDIIVAIHAQPSNIEGISSTGAIVELGSV